MIAGIPLIFEPYRDLNALVENVKPNMNHTL